MMFPFMSSYAHLFKRNGMKMPWEQDEEQEDFSPYPNYGLRPWEPEEDNSTGEGRRPLSQRSGFSEGLIGLGTQLLAAAPSGDYAGGLARGAAAFSGELQAGNERDRRNAIEAAEERRRQSQDARAEEQERDRNRAADLDYTRGNLEMDAWREQQERGKETRARTGKSAQQMADEIAALAARNPKDEKLQAMAKRAAGYALGEDSDLNKLADLHEDVTNQAFRDDDEQWKTKAEIEAKRAEYAAGVEVNPVEAQRRAEARANEQLNISRGHLGLAQERANEERNRLTPLQVYDRLEKKVKEKMDTRTKSYVEATGREPMPGQLAEWRRQAVQEASEELETRMGSAYRYTQDGSLEPDDY